jgi:dienelactone hydrolase
MGDERPADKIGRVGWADAIQVSERSSLDPLDRVATLAMTFRGNRAGIMGEAEIQAESVTFASLHAPEPLRVPAWLKRPATPGRAPAVVIAHGSAGIDSRGPSYARALNAAGIAAFEIDMWAARGLKGGLDRPKSIPETLPDVFGALRYLAARADIDPQAIGIMGFSWGGALSMLSATKPYAERYLAAGERFAAHAPLYPVCWLYNQVPGFEFADFTGAPVFIQCGELDAYDEPDTGEKLVRSLAGVAPGLLSITTYPGATHGFDRIEPEMTVTDPYSHLGRGGPVRFAANPLAAAAARTAAASFFRGAFGLSKTPGP